MYDGVGLSGDGNSAGTRDGVNSTEACCTICGSIAHCKAFTYVLIAHCSLPIAHCSC